MNRQDLINKLVAKRKRDISFTWQQVLTALGRATAKQRVEIATAVDRDEAAKVGMLILRVVEIQKRQQAEADVNAMIVNGRIDLDDVAGIMK